MASLRRPVLDRSLPTGGMERDLGQGQGERLLDFFVISDCPPPSTLVTEPVCLGLNPHFLPTLPALPAAAAVIPGRPRVDRE